MKKIGEIRIDLMQGATHYELRWPDGRALKFKDIEDLSAVLMADAIHYETGKILEGLRPVQSSLENAAGVSRYAGLCNKAILSKSGLRHCNAPRGHEGECP
jgi:hypothetical protein